VWWFVALTGVFSKCRLSWFSLTISRRDVFFLLNLRGNASMADQPSDLVGGNSGQCSSLKTLALEPMHGYGIAVRLER